MPITSAAAFFREAAGKQVRKTVTGVATVESWPEVKADILRQLDAQGCAASDIATDDDGTLRVKSTGQFWMKPKVRAEEVGTLQVRSADYGFVSANYPKPVWGDKKGATIESGKLVKRYPHGMVVTFEVLA